MTAPWEMKQGESLEPDGDVLTREGEPIDLSDNEEWIVSGTFRWGKASSTVTREAIYLPEDLAVGLVRPTLKWDDSNTATMQPGEWVFDARIYEVATDTPRYTANQKLIVHEAVTDTPVEP